jgi:hypothetical protein
MLDRAVEAVDEDALELHLVPELLEQRQQAVIDDDEAIFRVLGDVGDVLGEQAQVQRVHHAAGRGNPEIGLEVDRVVPHERGDAVAGLEARLDQRLRQLARAPVDLAVGGAVQGLVRPPRDHLDVRERAACALEQHVERQGDVHHRGLHGVWLLA